MDDANFQTKIYSGYRLRFLEPKQQPYAWEELKRNVTPYAAIMAQVDEPYAQDDYVKALPPLDLLLGSLQGGEFIVCVYDDPQAKLLPRQTLVGLAWIDDIWHERSAQLHAWSNPICRQDYKRRRIAHKFAREIVEYAFKDFGSIKEGGGLGLKKLKANIAAPNYSAYRALHALGFRDTGLSPLDGLYNSLPTDTLNLELLNPDYFGLAEAEVIQSNAIRRRGQSPEIPNLLTPGPICQPGTVPSTTGSQHDGAERNQRDSGNEDGGTGRGTTTGLVADQPEPNEPSGIAAIRAQLLSEGSSTPASASASRRLRKPAK